MFSLRHIRTALISLTCLGLCAAQAAEPKLDAHLGKIAAWQTRHIATYFPGRMAGSPAELIAADYLTQHFNQMGYQSSLHSFKTRYIYTSENGKQSWQNINATSVKALHAGEVPQQIVVMAHFDTYMPLSDNDANHNLGGLTLQGVDDNASGVGVMLELAQRMSNIPTHYSLRFVALSAEQTGSQGAKDFVDSMTHEERKNTLLVINLNSLIVGERLYFNSGTHTSAEVTKLSRNRALALAQRLQIPAATSPATANSDGDLQPLDDANIPLLLVSASDWTLGNKDGKQQRAISKHFPEGTSRKQGQLDNLQYLDRYLPGRIAKRSSDSVKILLPLLQELANPSSAARS